MIYLGEVLQIAKRHVDTFWFKTQEQSWVNKYANNTQALSLFQDGHYKLSCRSMLCDIWDIEVPVNPLYGYLSREVNLIIYSQ